MTPKRVLLISTCDPLAEIACTRLLRGKEEYYQLAGLIQTRTPLSMQWRLFKRVANQGATYYALYILAEIYGALVINYMLRISKFFNGRVKSAESIRKVIRRSGLPLYTTNDVNSNECIKFIQNLKVDVVLSVRPVHIFRDALINAVPPILNLHCSMLPHYRGVGAVLQALAANEYWLGCTVHKVEGESIDRGSIVHQSKVKTVAGKSVFYHTLKLYKEAQTVIHKTLLKVACDELSGQPNVGGSYFSWPDKAVLNRLHQGGRRLMTIRDILFGTRYM